MQFVSGCRPWCSVRLDAPDSGPSKPIKARCVREEVEEALKKSWSPIQRTSLLLAVSKYRLCYKRAPIEL
jgi:hypothetical protein